MSIRNIKMVYRIEMTLELVKLDLSVFLVPLKGTKNANSTDVKNNN